MFLSLREKHSRNWLKYIFAFFVVIYSLFFGSNSIHAQEELLNLLPTESDLQQIRPGWIAFHHGIEAGPLINHNEGWAHFHADFSENGEIYTSYLPNYRYADRLRIGVSIRKEESPAAALESLEYRRNALDYQSYEPNYFGEDVIALYGIIHQDLGDSPLSMARNVFIEISKAEYWILISVTGVAESELGLPEHQKGITQLSVPTLNDAETLTWIILNKIAVNEGITSDLSLLPVNHDSTPGTFPGQGEAGSPTFGPTGSPSPGPPARIDAEVPGGKLFAAVGLTALIAFLGGLGTTVAQGLSIKDAWSEMVTIFKGAVDTVKENAATTFSSAEQPPYPEAIPPDEPPLSPPPPPEDVEEFWTEVETEIAEQVEIEEAKSAEPEPDHEHFAAETPEHRDPSPTLAQASDDVLKWADNWQKYQESAAKKAIDQEDLVVLTDWRKTGVPLAEIELRYQLMLSQKKGTYHFYRAVVDVATSKAKNAPLVYLGGKMATLPVKIAAGAVSAADAMADLTTAWVESKDPVQMRPILNEYIFSYDLKEEDLQRLLDQNDKLRVSIDHEVKELKVKIAELMNPRDKSFMDADALKPLSLAKEKITEVERLEAKRRYIDYQTNAYSTRLKTGWPGK
jgi:hypothetical protein